MNKLLKLHETTFEQFAEAVPTFYCGSVANEETTPRHRLEWLAYPWDSSEIRVTYSASWRTSSVLTEPLPPEALANRFDDVELDPILKSVGLEPGSSEDRREMAQWLATANAWIAGIQAYCTKEYAAGRSGTLATHVANDYIVLTANKLAHPWIKKKISGQIEANNRRQEDTPPEAVEMSTDPRWPNTRVFHLTSTSERKPNNESIQHWINHFDYENGKWSSAYDEDIWKAQRDVELAKRKIKGLQALVETQEQLILKLHRWIRWNKRQEAAIYQLDRERGRPKISSEKQEIACKFAMEWVASLMSLLKANNPSELETWVEGCNQRNWRRWATGKSIPTPTTLSGLQDAVVIRGEFKGYTLSAVPTTPTYGKLLELIRLCNVVSKNDQFLDCHVM